MARRSGLGKGLGALIPAGVSGDRQSALRQVPISDIRPNPNQPRAHFDEESLASLSASIRELGVLQPILVRAISEDQYELIAGERRWRASKRAGLQTIPVIVHNVDDLGSLEQALVENLHRADLSPLEEAAAYQQLIDQFSYTHEQVAGRVGKSRTAITNTLRLLQLPAGVQRSVAEGTLSAGHARALLGTPDRAFQEELAKRAVAEGLTVRAVEEQVRIRSNPEEVTESPVHPGGASQAPADDPADTTTDIPSTRASKEPVADRKATPVVPSELGRRPLPAPGVLELEELLAAYLNTRVKVEMGGRHGKVVIDFSTLEDLERIYTLMVGGS